ncbi:MBL fold metallo-hydrolase [Candidatus Bathyarchaeota archaeon]|nr:MAG: MBL fold metallo-hydrolase [Candidatus Bathyarchaeota archaeon]
MRYLNFSLIWFDSLGAKSTCTLVETPDTSILVDPGAAIMQPGFPASIDKKIYWLEKARKAIKRASKKAKIIIISHYHYDHFTDFSKTLYNGKLVLAKNPNEYINDSQRERAEEFYNNVCKAFGKTKLENLLQEKEKKVYPDPLEELPMAMSMDYGDYNKRKKELLEKGRKWFRARVEKWNGYKRIPELNFKNCQVKFADGEKFKFGETTIKFTKPLFHGIEFARVGWVISTIISYRNEKIIHTSDLQGPTIEDYAEWIIREDPNVLILDGPSTYLIPYMLNLINLKRTIKNAIEIIEKTKKLNLIIYDHHLLREPRYKERVHQVYQKAEEKRKIVLTAAEHLGKTPVVLKERH